LNNLVIGGSDGGTEVIGKIYVHNNVIVNAGDAGLRINDPRATVAIQNNVFYNNGSAEGSVPAQIFLERPGSGVVALQNNIFYAGPRQSYYVVADGGEPPGSLRADHNLCFNAGPCAPWDLNSVNADPQFVNPAALDFRVLPSSPAIDAGTNTTIRSDYDGVPRPQQRAYDIGVYEVSAEPPAHYP
jgi:hypothetical protein